jgi:hypothetical protein
MLEQEQIRKWIMEAIYFDRKNRMIPQNGFQKRAVQVGVIIVIIILYIYIYIYIGSIYNMFIENYCYNT